MEEDHSYYKQIVHDLRYAENPKSGKFSKFESLKLSIKRTLHFRRKLLCHKLRLGSQY